jgi:hypothetical protein
MRYVPISPRLVHARYGVPSTLLYSRAGELSLSRNSESKYTVKLSLYAVTVLVVAAPVSV